MGGASMNKWAVARQLEEILPSSAEAGKQLCPQDVVKAILDLDLKQVGAPCLPEDINRADSKKLIGPHILQLVEATDISRPSKFQETIPEDRKNRLLRLRLTDGSKTCTAIEYTSIPSLNTKYLIPGVKVKIQNALIRAGALLLDSSTSMAVLGGRVERLAAAWEVQQMYGGTAERSSTNTGANKGSTPADSSTTASAKPDKPLPFKHFDAQASSGHEKMKKALAAVVVPTVGVVVQAVGGKNNGPGTGPNSQQRNMIRSSKDSLPPGIAVGSSTNPTAAAATTTTTTTSEAAKSKLLERLSAHEDAHGRYGRGGGRGKERGRGGRRGRFNNGDYDDGDDGSMTLEEWEAKKKVGILVGVGGVQSDENKSDEQLARELQKQLDLEDMMGTTGAAESCLGDIHSAGAGNLQSELLGMFSYGDQKEEEYSNGGGDGRGRGRRGKGGRGDRGGRGRGVVGDTRGGGRGRGRHGGSDVGGSRGKGGGRSGGRGRGPPSRGRGRDGGRS
ncbi:putative Tudor domain-containing protein 3 [Nannochloris sp. 'desiccata']|nr:putative Tudor domain-containing protein 3 [Chlorella desiccata (nom. nud.)]